MHMNKSLWLLIVLVFSLAGCDDITSTPAQVEDTPTPALLPDFIIKDVVIEPEPTGQLLIRGITYSFKVNVVNIGQGPVRGAITVGAPYQCPGQGSAPNILFAGNDLAPGESRLSQSFSVTIPTGNAGNCTFIFSVDPDNIHAESDESSNSNIKKVTFEVP